MRYLDFPRLQAATALLVALVLHVLAAWRHPRHLPLMALALVALAWQGSRLYLYTSFVPPMAVRAIECGEGADLRILVAKVLRTNEETQPFLDLVAEAAPDLILAVETDAVWDQALDALDGYPYRVSHRSEAARFFGMHLLSALPLVTPEVLFEFEAETPSILTGVTLPSGVVLRLHGLHPRPPHWFSQGTTMRDATLLAAALEATGSDEPSILAGDLNAVPWEGTFRRAMRLGGLLDPRVGRGYMATYSARSAVMAWPLDHVLFQNELTLIGFERLPRINSDHYPVLAHLCHDPDAAARQPAIEPRPGDLKDAEAAFVAARRYDAGN